MLTITRRSSVRVLLLFAGCLFFMASIQAQDNATLHLALTIVDGDLNVKPVPHQAFQLRRSGNGSR